MSWEGRGRGGGGCMRECHGYYILSRGIPQFSRENPGVRSPTHHCSIVMEDFDKIQTAEFREAFDEFDKVSPHHSQTVTLVSLVPCQCDAVSLSLPFKSLDKYERCHRLVCLFVRDFNFLQRKYFSCLKGRKWSDLLQGAALRDESHGPEPHRGRAQQPRHASRPRWKRNN